MAVSTTLSPKTLLRYMAGLAFCCAGVGVTLNHLLSGKFYLYGVKIMFFETKHTFFVRSWQLSCATHFDTHCRRYTTTSMAAAAARPRNTVWQTNGNLDSYCFTSCRQCLLLWISLSLFHTLLCCYKFYTSLLRPCQLIRQLCKYRDLHLH